MTKTHLLQLTIPYTNWSMCKLFLTHNYMNEEIEYVVTESLNTRCMTITFKTGSNYLLFKHSWTHILISAED